MQVAELVSFGISPNSQALPALPIHLTVLVVPSRLPECRDARFTRQLLPLPRRCGVLQWKLPLAKGVQIRGSPERGEISERASIPEFGGPALGGASCFCLRHSAARLLACLSVSVKCRTCKKPTVSRALKMSLTPIIWLSQEKWRSPLAA